MKVLVWVHQDEGLTIRLWWHPRGISAFSLETVHYGQSCTIPLPKHLAREMAGVILEESKDR